MQNFYENMYIMENLKIAIFNGFNFHYEVMGFIIHYCVVKEIKLIIYCHLDESNGYIDLFQSFFREHTHEYRPLEHFDKEKYDYNHIILLTDDDFYFNTNDPIINERTIRLDHHFLKRRPEINKCIALRPFFDGTFRPWALPCYPLICKQDKPRSTDKTHIAIVGSDHFYHSCIINRLTSNKPIVIHAISRDIDASKFMGINNDNITVHLHKNISAFDLCFILVSCDYALTDVAMDISYEHAKMSGLIPLSFSTLLPLIISKQTNSHYQFKNVIEFDKYSMDPIVLTEMNTDFFERLENERRCLINQFFIIMQQII